MWQISYPPVNGASQGNYFQPKSNELAVFKEKTGLQKQLYLMFKNMKVQPGLAAKVANFLTTDRQTNSLTPYIDRVQLKTPNVKVKELI